MLKFIKSRIYYQLAIKNRQMEQFGNAFMNLDKAIEMDPHYALAYFQRGLVKASCGEFKDAIADYDEAARLKPNLANVREARDLAVEGLDLLADISKSLPRASYNPGRDAPGTFSDLIQYNKDNLRQMKEDNPGATFLGQGVAALLLDNLPNALNCFDGCIRINAESGVAYAFRGEVKARLDDYQGAVSDCDKAIALIRDDSELIGRVYFYRAGVQLALAQWDEAISDVDESIRHEPNHAPSYLLRATVTMCYFEAAVGVFNSVVRPDQIRDKYYALEKSRHFARAVVADIDKAGELAVQSQNLELIEKVAQVDKEFASVVASMSESLGETPMSTPD